MKSYTSYGHNTKYAIKFSHTFVWNTSHHWHCLAVNSWSSTVNEFLSLCSRESEDPRSNSLSVHQDISYIQQRRPPSMVSPNLKPLDPSMEISLFDRRRQIIEKRASVFLGDSDSRDTVSISDFDSKAVHDTGVRTNTKALKDSRDKAAKSVEEETYLENRIPYRQSVTTRQSSESPPKLDECEDEVQTMQPPNILVSTTIALDGGNCGLERDFMENKELQTEVGRPNE